MDVYWLEQSVADLPDDSDWLSEAEARQLATFRVPKRRSDWLLGRWTAKRILAVRLGLPFGAASLAAIDVRPATSGAPEPFIGDERVSLALSLSHCNGKAVAVVSSPEARLGCDLEAIEPRGNAFLTDYFTESEQAMIRQTPEPERWIRLAFLWSAKESALKAMEVGLRADTRNVQVRPDPASPVHNSRWTSFYVDCTDGTTFEGFWSHDSAYVKTLVATPAPFFPIEIDCVTR